MAVRSTELQVFGLAKYGAVKLIVPSTAATTRPNDGTTRQFECKKERNTRECTCSALKKKNVEELSHYPKRPGRCFAPIIVFILF